MQQSQRMAEVNFVPDGYDSGGCFDESPYISSELFTKILISRHLILLMRNSAIFLISGVKQKMEGKKRVR